MKEMQPKSLRKLMKVSAKDKVEDTGKGNNEEVEFKGDQAWDDVTGEELDRAEVMRARAKEMGYIYEKGVWERMCRKRAIASGYKVVKRRWIDINKGDWENPNFRSRFVAKEFNDGAGEGLFASTPPARSAQIPVERGRDGGRWNPGWHLRGRA